MATKLTAEEQDSIVQDLRNVEMALEHVGQRLCDAEGGGVAWNRVTQTVFMVQDAIRDVGNISVIPN